MLEEIVHRVSNDDPVRGRWPVSNAAVGKVWCDASNLAVGVCVEINGDIVEDACWLRQKNDASHINLAELDAVLKGVNLALKWNLTRMEIVTDSATVYSWLNSILTLNRRICTHGLGEALVRRRLSLLADLIKECNLQVSVVKVASEVNRADRLTRVPRRWLSARPTTTSFIAVSNEEKADEIRRLHQWHHFGKRRTLYVVNHVRPDLRASEEDVKRIVEACPR